MRNSCHICLKPYDMVTLYEIPYTIILTLSTSLTLHIPQIQNHFSHSIIIALCLLFGDLFSSSEIIFIRYYYYLQFLYLDYIYIYIYTIYIYIYIYIYEHMHVLCIRGGLPLLQMKWIFESLLFMWSSLRVQIYSK